MSRWLAWPASPSSLGPLSSRGAPAWRRRRVARRTALAALEHARHLVLEHVQGADHLADALAGEILEIAGFVDLHHVVLDVLGQPALVVGLQRGGERLGAVVDDLDRFQDLLRGLFHAVDRGAEFVGRARHAALLAVADQRGQIALVAGDGVVDERQLALETLHGVGGVAVAPFGQRAQRLEFVDRRVTRFRRGRATAGEHLLDAENFTLHATPPLIPNAVVLPQRPLTLGCGQ